MSSKLLSLTIFAALSVSSLWSTTSMAQYAQEPYAPPPGYYAPQPYPPPAYAPQSISGYHEHDGFYLRALLGLGYLHTSASYAGDSEKVYGVGVTFGLAVGGVVAPNLVVYGEFFGTSASDPTFESNGSSATASGLTATMAGIGPGVAYYLDGNMYLSGTLLFTKRSFSDSDTNDQLASTNWGIGAGLTFGKEWWVTGDWGLGVSGQFQMASMKDNGYDTRWTAITASLLCSVTYN